MDERDWHIITVLYEHKNITKAAEVLFISQPALTARVRHIEEAFGIKIIYRGSRGIHFTPEGEYLVKGAYDVLAHIQHIREHALNLGTEIKGTLRIASCNYLAKFKLPRLLGRFKELYPAVEFNVINAWSRDICKMIYNQDVHIGFVRNDYGWLGEKVVLHEEPICIASKKEFMLEDLPDMPRIDYNTDPSYKALLDKWWGEHFSRPPRVSMTVSQMDISKAMVANGLGYSILPDTILNDVGLIYKLPVFDEAGKPIIRKTTMVYQKEILELKLVKKFVDFTKTFDFNELC
jgi:DNA-binding transcriptional LysR family regulator